MNAIGVERDVFVVSMEEHWTKLGNVSSKRLRDVWRKLCRTLNDQITRTLDDPWRVFPGELGVGKTEGLKMYCSLLPYDANHPGALVVVPRIEQANQFRDGVNEMSDLPYMAYAYHSELTPAQKKSLRTGPTPLDGLADYPTLVITHQAYERGLNALVRDEVHPKWNHLTRFRPKGGATPQDAKPVRRLVVIDESMNLVQTTSVTWDDLLQLQRDLRDLPRSLTKEHVAAGDVIATVAERLRQSERVGRHFPVDPSEWLTKPSEAREVIEALWAAVKDAPIREDRRRSRTTSQKRGESRATLDALKRLLGQSVWIFNQGASPMLTTSWLLLPEDWDSAAACILDATARQNVVYRHHPKFEVVSAPTARNYSAVTLHVAYESKTGKRSTTKEIMPMTQAALASILREQGEAAANEKVLVITSEANERGLKGLVKTGFAGISHGHWNALDGANTWDDHGIVLVMSLLYQPDHVYLNAHQALKGPLNETGLNDPPDLVRELRQSQMTVDLAQAVNRARCRRVIDVAGRCQKTDVYLRLPDHDRQISTDRLLADLREAMPGVKVVPWEIDASASLKGSKREAAPALIGFASGMKPGETVLSPEVRAAIGLAGEKRERQWMRLVKDMSSPSSALVQELLRMGVAYTKTVQGRRLIGALQKSLEATKFDPHR
jgi:hypothetical protein